jgi:hypothetical protein
MHCSKIAEAEAAVSVNEAAVSVNEKKWLVMHMHVQLKLDVLWGPPNPWLKRMQFRANIAPSPPQQQGDTAMWRTAYGQQKTMRSLSEVVPV